MSHVTHMNESCHTHRCATSYTFAHTHGCVTAYPCAHIHMTTSCHTYKWVMSHTCKWGHIPWAYAEGIYPSHVHSQKNPTQIYGGYTPLTYIEGIYRIYCLPYIPSIYVYRVLLRVYIWRVYTLDIWRGYTPFIYALSKEPYAHWT